MIVVMYHGIGRPESEWQHTPQALQYDLERLYEEGYRPIALRDFVAGEISVPAGLSPVVLTFDDGRANNFELIDGPQGRVAAPETAVGILEAFNAAHPDFPLEATFFLFGGRPFGDAATAQEKVRYLLDRGMDIGNHTDAHANLSLPRYGTAQAIQQTIGAQARRLEAMAGKANIVDTFALCYGARPRNRALFRYLLAGSYRGHSYRHIAVLNVGGPPAASPYDASFDPTRLPRIRGSLFPTAKRGLLYWLRTFDEQPGERFISDGDLGTVTIPSSAASRVSMPRVGSRRLVVL
ncbi:MAG: polysaccharide deacetylase family protein [Myxococcota bacterium]|nr:polysaccharide deacetylase family protein [Myxococcota bacterium]